MGLYGFRNNQIGELSTGTRRIAELACCVTLEPRLLLLDEPTAGIAQRETEALGDLLIRLREELGLTILIIEHDVPLVMRLADRIVAMEGGMVLASGSPEEIRSNPLVIESYLGGALETSTQVVPR
jgi:ABC-type branched-subunit amino acid transport system ATPase component